MMEKIKLCKDCKHHRPYFEKFLFWKIFTPMYDKCAALKNINLVSSEAGQFCRIERSADSGFISYPCGRGGDLWEPKNEIHPRP